MKILVPIDFSPASEKALDFALILASILKCKIAMLHAIYYYGHSRVLLRGKYLVNAMEQVAEENFEALIKKLERIHRKDPDFFSYYIVHGNLTDEINRFADKLKAPVIVMGTTGASGLKKFFIGSNTVAVIENSHYPVIAVPEKNNVQNISRVMYTTDTKNISEEIKNLMPLVRMFDASLIILHVRQNGALSQEELLQKVERYQKDYDYEKISYIEVCGNDIIKIIDKQLTANRIDMLAMFPHEKDFSQKLFGKSITDEVAFRTHIPLLSIKK